MAKKKSEWFDWLKALLIAILLAFIVRTFLFSPIIVEGPSMQPNLQNGDHMIVNKINYKLNEPERFDIVVFHATEKRDYIKRVIGLPGETVEMRADTLYIDGEPVEESFLATEKSQQASGQVYTMNFSMEDSQYLPEVIPEGHVFVLGDNRSNSTDSRSSSLGLISYDQIVGNAVLIYWPINRFGFANE
ncbi:signal peptidase I [Paraliobacillus quinghaiensis]|uniref:Signal peptidase I n=1 Tax=Paraliobacillus quinghaiensis TaxID=470815 RepID=A0A917TF73_9BACI|nr:signal peptidase I [Paraliobacillus quinghaiensis]GGM21279.1 signal peptidase I [Paraliobacillus quinghaiensis]